MILALLASLAFADTLTLDNGAVVEGELAAYQYGGDCHISVTDGDLAGAIVTLPCERLTRFERELPVEAPLVEVLPPIGDEELPVAPEILAFPAEAVVDAPEAQAPLEPQQPDQASVPLDAAVSVDPALLAPASGRAPSPPRAPTVRDPVAPERTGPATLSW